MQLTISGNTYAIATAYDSASRIAKVTYPSGFAVAYGYNAIGYQHQLSNAITAEPYWTADVRDAELHLTRQTAGNGVVTYQTFDANTGQLTGITAGDAAKVQSHAYTYDLLGKLLTRSDGNTGLSESFTYDTLNRLTSSTVSLTPVPWVQTIAYNAIGNILSKSGVGTYSYPVAGQPRPHGVASISGGTISTTFSYDAKGNMTSGKRADHCLHRLQQAGQHHPRHHHHRLRPRPRAPALYPARPLRDHALPRRCRRVRRALRRHRRRRGAMDQLPDRGRQAGWRAHSEGG